MQMKTIGFFILCISNLYAGQPPWKRNEHSSEVAPLMPLIRALDLPKGEPDKSESSSDPSSGCETNTNWLLKAPVRENCCRVRIRRDARAGIAGRCSDAIRQVFDGDMRERYDRNGKWDNTGLSKKDRDMLSVLSATVQKQYITAVLYARLQQDISQDSAVVAAIKTNLTGPAKDRLVAAINYFKGQPRVACFAAYCYMYDILPHEQRFVSGKRRVFTPPNRLKKPNDAS